MKKLAVLVIAIASLTACKKKKEETNSTTSTSGAKTAEPKSGGGQWAAWDMPAREAALQGAHVGPGGSIGFWEAWDIKGDKITTWDGKEEKTLEVKLVSPCEMKVTEKSGGGSSSTTHHYTLLDGKFASGLGDAGSKKGTEAIACVSNKIVTLDAAGKCTEWDEMFDKYEQKPGTCSWKKDGDKEVFAVTVNGSETMLEVHGDALMSQQLFQTHSEKVADFAAAKTARDTKK